MASHDDRASTQSYFYAKRHALDSLSALLRRCPIQCPTAPLQFASKEWSQQTNGVFATLSAKYNARASLYQHDPRAVLLVCRVPLAVRAAGGLQVRGCFPVVLRTRKHRSKNMRRRRSRALVAFESVPVSVTFKQGRRPVPSSVERGSTGGHPGVVQVRAGAEALALLLVVEHHEEYDEG